MEAHRTVLRVVTEAVNDQFCCLLYLAILLKCEHHLFLKAGDGGRGGGGVEGKGSGRVEEWQGGKGRMRGLECQGMGYCIYVYLL